jgi:hypothetical protein
MCVLHKTWRGAINFAVIDVFARGVRGDRCGLIAVSGVCGKKRPPTLVRYCNDAIRTRQITEQCRTIDSAVLPIAPPLPGPYFDNPSRISKKAEETNTAHLSNNTPVSTSEENLPKLSQKIASSVQSERNSIHRIFFPRNIPVFWHI